MAAEGNATLRVDGSCDVSPRIGHVAIIKDNYMLVWGGYTEDGLGERYLSPKYLMVYHAVFGYWTSHKTSGSIPLGASGAEAYLVGNQMYVFAGHGETLESQNHVQNYNSLHSLDLKTLCWKQIAYESSEEWPSPRDKFSSWTWENRLYCFGGFGPAIRDYCGSFVLDAPSIFRGWNNQLWYFDTLTQKWTFSKCKGTPPLPRAAHKAVALNSKAYIFGGRHGSTRMNDLHSFDMETECWSGELCIEGAFPCGRSWHSFTAVSETTAFLYGGYSNDNQPLSDAWLLDVSVLQWTQLTVSGNRPRLWHTGCSTMSGDVIIFGGCCSDILQQEEPVVQSREVLLFQTTPYSLLRLCLEASYANKAVTQCDWNMLPITLKEWLEKKEQATEIQKRAREKTSVTVNGSTCAIS